MNENIFKSISDVRRTLVQDFFSSEDNLSNIATYITNLSDGNVTTNVEDGTIIVITVTKDTSKIEEAIRTAVMLFIQERKVEIMRSLIFLSKDTGSLYHDILVHPEYVFDTINMTSKIIVRF